MPAKERQLCEHVKASTECDSSFLAFFDESWTISVGSEALDFKNEADSAEKTITPHHKSVKR